MTDTLTKLYAGLTDTERGKMACAYLLQGNDLERKRIESTMPEQYFVELPADYRRAITNTLSFTMFYAMVYWEQVARCLCFMGGTTVLLRADDPEAYKPILKRFEAAEATLLAMEQAFDDVCLEHGLDSARIRGMAGNQFYRCSDTDLQPDGDALADFREIFAGLTHA